MTEYNYTRIVTYIDFHITDDCPSCNEDIIELYREYSDCYNDTPPECTCEQNPRGRMIISCVRVSQKPIVSKPAVIDFDISCWDVECRKDDTNYINIKNFVDTSNPTNRFIIPVAECSMDLERDNSKLISKFLTIKKITNVHLNKNKKFRAPCNVNSYEMELKKRCEDILKQQPRKDQNYNPHVRRNKKISRKR